jgi:hypothetical protein
VEEKEPQGRDVYAIKILPCRGTSIYSLVMSKVFSTSLTCSFPFLLPLFLDVSTGVVKGA